MPGNTAKTSREKLDRCVLALAIQNHTRFFETKTPQELLDHLNHLHEFIGHIIVRHGGSVANLTGEKCIVVFGALEYDGCQEAVDAARMVLDQTETEIRRKTIPHASIHIALHYGPVIAGNVGTRQNKPYTVLGDTVDITTRINQLHRFHESRIVVSSAVLSRIETAGAGRVESLGPVPVKGQVEPVEVFRLV